MADIVPEDGEEVKGVVEGYYELPRGCGRLPGGLEAVMTAAYQRGVKMRSRSFFIQWLKLALHDQSHTRRYFGTTAKSHDYSSL